MLTITPKFQWFYIIELYFFPFLHFLQFSIVFGRQSSMWWFRDLDLFYSVAPLSPRMTGFPPGLFWIWLIDYIGPCYGNSWLQDRVRNVICISETWNNDFQNISTLTQKPGAPLNETVGRPGLGLLLRCVRGWLHDRAVWRAPCLEEPCTGFNGLLLSQVIKSFLNKGLGIFIFLRAPQIV